MDFLRGDRPSIGRPGIHVVAHAEGGRHVPRARLLHGAVTAPSAASIIPTAIAIWCSPSAASTSCAITPRRAAGKVNTGPVLYPYLKKNNGIAMLAHLAHRHGNGLARQRSGGRADRRDLAGRAHFGRARRRAARADGEAHRIVGGRLQAAGLRLERLGQGIQARRAGQFRPRLDAPFLRLRDRGRRQPRSADRRDARSATPTPRPQYPDGLPHESRTARPISRETNQRAIAAGNLGEHQRHRAAEEGGHRTRQPIHLLERARRAKPSICDTGRIRSRRASTTTMCALEQKDGNMAWSSPIWVKYQSERKIT